MIALGGPWVGEGAIIEAVGNQSRGVPQHQAALFDGDGPAELRGGGGQLRSTEPLVGQRSPLVARSLHGVVAHRRVDRVAVGQWIVERDSGAEGLDRLVAEMSKGRRGLEGDSCSAIAEWEVGCVVELQGAARPRPVPGETTHSLTTWELLRAGVKSMAVPSGPLLPTAVTVAVCRLAGAPTVIASPTAKPSARRTLMRVAPAPAGALRLV